jgi:hypothetical protein
MASRELRNRTVECPQEALELPAGEETPQKELGSLGETSESNKLAPQVVAVETQPEVLTVEQEIRTNTPPVTATGPTDKLEQMIAGVMTAIQQTNAKIGSVKADLKADMKAEISSVKADIKAEISSVI